MSTTAWQTNFCSRFSSSAVTTRFVRIFWPTSSTWPDCQCPWQQPWCESLDFWKKAFRTFPRVLCQTSKQEKSGNIPSTLKFPFYWNDSFTALENLLTWNNFWLCILNIIKRTDDCSFTVNEKYKVSKPKMDIWDDNIINKDKMLLMKWRNVN